MNFYSKSLPVKKTEGIATPPSIPHFLILVFLL